jgi:hypothetical protein
MTILLVIAALLAALVTTVFVLGYWLGDSQARQELVRVQLQAAEARRNMHDLTRQAFVVMAEEVERRRFPGR